jgi:hypothetical protein
MVSLLHVFIDAEILHVHLHLNVVLFVHLNDVHRCTFSDAAELQHACSIDMCLSWLQIAKSRLSSSSFPNYRLTALELRPKAQDNCC